MKQFELSYSVALNALKAMNVEITQEIITKLKVQTHIRVAEIKNKAREVMDPRKITIK